MNFYFRKSVFMHHISYSLNKSFRSRTKTNSYLDTVFTSVSTNPIYATISIYYPKNKCFLKFCWNKTEILQNESFIIHYSQIINIFTNFFVSNLKSGNRIIFFIFRRMRSAMIYWSFIFQFFFYFFKKMAIPFLQSYFYYIC